MLLTIWLIFVAALLVVLVIVLWPGRSGRALRTDLAVDLHNVAHWLGINRKSHSICETGRNDWYKVGQRCVKCGEFETWFLWNSITDERIDQHEQD